jgi:hypothetical protein
VTSQPQPPWGWLGGADSDQGRVGSDQGPGEPRVVSTAGRAQGSLTRGDRGGRRRGPRAVAFGLVLAIGLLGLGVAAVGIAHRLLPRHFTAAQERQIMGWEMERRWRVLPAGKIFPAVVPYTVSAAALDAPANLTLQAQRLAISSQQSCSAVVTTAAASVLEHGGCSTAFEATYVDSSGSMVATVVVAVLPASSAASSVAHALKAAVYGAPGPVQAFPVAGTAAAGFGDAQRQLSHVEAAGPYVILSTAGFTDGRPGLVATDAYLDAEMASLTEGLVSSAQRVLGKPPPVPVCPGAPGC